MAALQWHIEAQWGTLYAQFPNPSTGYAPAVAARMQPDYLTSALSLWLAPTLVGLVALAATLAFPGRARRAALSVFAGAWIVTEGRMLATPGALSSNLGPLAVLVHFLLSAVLLGGGATLGAALGVVIHRLRSRLF